MLINLTGINKIIHKHDKVTLGSPFLLRKSKIDKDEKIKLNQLNLEVEGIKNALLQLKELFKTFDGPGDLETLCLKDPSLKDRVLPFDFDRKKRFIIGTKKCSFLKNILFI